MHMPAKDFHLLIGCHFGSCWNNLLISPDAVSFRVQYDRFCWCFKSFITDFGSELSGSTKYCETRITQRVLFTECQCLQSWQKSSYWKNVFGSQWLLWRILNMKKLQFLSKGTWDKPWVYLIHLLLQITIVFFFLLLSVSSRFFFFLGFH